MKILVLNYEFPPLGGGAGNATLRMFEVFSGYSELEIHLVTSSLGKFRKENFSSNITIHFLDIGKDPRQIFNQSIGNLITYTWKAYKYARELVTLHNFDLIHAFFGIPCGYIAMKMGGVPYIVSLRGSDVPFYSKKYKWLDRFFLKRMSGKIWKRAAYVVANSRGLKALALQSYPKQVIEVIPNGIDLQKFYPASRKNRKGMLRVIAVGRFIPRKGYGYLIKALEGLQSQVQLSLVGAGPLKEELESIAKQVEGNVHFTGRVPHEELPELYRSHDVYVQSSFNEGMSNTLLEAMASGLAVVATNTGGSEELVSGNGFLVSMRDSKDIREKLLHLCNNSVLVKEMGVRSRIVAEQFGWEHCAGQYNNLYKSSVELPINEL